MFLPPGYLNLPLFNRAVKQLGLGDTSTMSTEEVRLFSENGAYRLRISDGTTNVLINNPYENQTPVVYTWRRLISVQGEVLYFSPSLKVKPCITATAETGGVLTNVTSIQNTQFRVYLYNQAGNFISSWVQIHIVGESN